MPSNEKGNKSIGESSSYHDNLSLHDLLVEANLLLDFILGMKKFKLINFSGNSCYNGVYNAFF